MTRGEALEILGLDSDVSLDEAKQTYRTLVKHYHPDKNTASNAAAMFRIIQDAWEVIQNAAEQEHSEAEIRPQHTEAETTHRRDAEEAARRRAEATTERKRSEEARSQAENTRRQKEKRITKKIKRYCHIWSIYLVLILVGALFRTQIDSINFSPWWWIIICGAILFSGWLNGWVIIKSRQSKAKIEKNIIYYCCCFNCGFNLLYGVGLSIMTFVTGDVLVLEPMGFAMWAFPIPIGVFFGWFFGWVMIIMISPRL